MAEKMPNQTEGKLTFLFCKYLVFLVQRFAPTWNEFRPQLLLYEAPSLSLCVVKTLPEEHNIQLIISNQQQCIHTNTNTPL